MRVQFGKCIFAITLCMSCSADDAAPSAIDSQTESASVPDELTLDRVTTEQRDVLCEEFELDEEPVVDAYDEVLCTVFGLRAAAQGIGGCEQVRDLCLSNEDEEDEEEEEDAVDDCALPGPVSCRKTTVGELRACTKAAVARDERAGKLAVELKLTCESELPSDLLDQLPASCQLVLDECSGLAIEEEVD